MFFKRGEGGGGWYLGVVQSMGHAHKMLKTATLEILAMPQSRNYDKIPVQSVFHNIHIFLFCFSETGVASHPLHSLITNSYRLLSE